MRRNALRGTVIGILLGTIAAGFSMTALADETIMEDDYYIVAEDGMTVSDEESYILEDSFASGENEPDTEDEFAFGLITDETETDLQAAGDPEEPISASEGEGIPINADTFEDPVFLEYIKNRIDKDNNGFLSEEEISQTTILGLTGPGDKISSLKGIELFTNLESLSCNSNNLTDLDVSKNTALTYLACQGNKLSSLDVSNNTELTTIMCYENQLQNLNLGNISKLNRLSCHVNQLTNLDIHNNTDLEWLECSQNQLSELNVGRNAALTRLVCYGNNLTSLNVQNNTELKVMICHENQLNTLDVGKNTLLEELNCNNNQLTSLDLRNNPKLTSLQCQKNSLNNLIVIGNPELTFLYCHDNQLTNLDLSRNTQLNKLRTENNQLAQLDISGSDILIETYLQGTWYSASGYYYHFIGSRSVLQYDNSTNINSGILCTEHQYETVSRTEPTAYRDGRIVSRCSLCGHIKEEVIPATGSGDNDSNTTAETSSDTTSSTGSGSIQQPMILSAAAEKITVTKKPSISKPTAAKNKITVNWKHFKNKTKKGKAIWKPIKKVQVQCAADSAFTNIVKTTIVGKGKTKAVIKGLQKNTTYYVRVRYYDGAGYSAWSGVKKVKTKK